MVHVPATTTKTLEATLVSPTAHKEDRLKRTVSTYRRALEAAFESGADTQSEVNDIVTPFDLTAYAKDAIKRYVPTLRETNASELSDEHPVRFTNRGWRLDYSGERTHGYCWRVPQAGRGNAFWIPLRINPEQRELWDKLYADVASVGEFRLQKNPTRWELHVTVSYDISEPQVPECPTPIGIDIGDSKLLTGCALKDAETPTQPFIFDGGRARRLRKERFTTLQRLQERGADWRLTERANYFKNALTDIYEKATRQAISYAKGFENPVIVLEDLSDFQQDIAYGTWMNRRLHSWAFDRLADRIEQKALYEGIPVRYVNPAYTSQICHECGHIGTRPTQSEFQCTNSECWVTEYQADINAAVNIANRLNPWGERLPWKPATDDFPRDGSRSGTATGHRTPSRDTD